VDVRNAVERIRLLPEVYVDCSIRQGREAILEQLRERDGSIADRIVDAFIAEDIQDTIATVVRKAEPYEIPDDYIFFLEFYGGLAIDRDDYYFATLGVGPWVEDWYGSIVSDQALQEPGECGFLSLGSVTVHKGEHGPPYISFFLDLAGTVQKHCVIGVGPWGVDTPDPETVLQDLQGHPEMWRKLAHSFTEWLEQAADTEGSFGYV
jgi:hypothetical protein